MLTLDQEQGKFCFLVLAVLEQKPHFPLVPSAMSLGQPTVAIVKMRVSHVQQVSASLVLVYLYVLNLLTCFVRPAFECIIAL